MKTLKGLHNTQTWKTAIVEYDSFRKLIEEVGDKRPAHDAGNHWKFGSFENVENTRQALLDGKVSDLVKKMTDELREKIEYEAVERFKGTGKSNKRRRTYQEEGDNFDLDRAMSGDPYCWEKTKRDGKNVTVALGINFALSCGNKEEEFAKTAALAIVAGDMLTRLGYSVAIKGLGTVHRLCGAYNEAGICITLKDSHEEYDMQRIAGCGITGLLRHFAFVAYDLNFKEVDSSYGRCMDTTDVMKELCEVDYLIETKWAERPMEFIENILNKLEDK